MRRAAKKWDRHATIGSWLNGGMTMRTWVMRTRTVGLCVAALLLSAALYAQQPPPDLVNMSYGPDPAQVLDLWKAKSDKPTPLVIFIHGGGFYGGDKKMVGGRPNQFLRAGVSCASVNYRLTPKVTYPAPMMDCVRAVQFLRYKAPELNLDPKKFACTGGSAGAGISLWIGFHDDLADPKSADPVARQSTRLTCMAVSNAQTSYDPRFIKRNIPGSGWRDGALPQLFGIKPTEIENPPPDKAKLMEDSAPINHLSADDPPVFLHYPMMALSDKEKPGEIHHVMFGVLLKEKMDALKIECVLVTRSPDSPLPKDAVTTGPDKTDVDFILRQFGIGKK